MKTQVHLNYMYQFSLYLTVTTVRLYLEDPPITTV